MANFSYTPNFHHLAYRDNIDLVEAEGTNGFNIRFDTIESDLKAVTTVVAAIGTAFDQLNARITPPPTAVASFAPTLQPVAGSPAWTLSVSASAVAPTTGAPTGVLPVTLPDKVKMTSITVQGRGVPPSGQNSTFFFTRVNLTTANNETIAVFDTHDVPFGTAKQLPDTEVSRVDLASFRYVITASSPPGVAANPVTLFAFQINYNNP